MLERKYDNCWFIWLELNNAGKIVNIFADELEYKNHSIDGFSDRELRELVDFVKKQRRKSGITMPSPRRKKIYPNDICPCGSGMKYKSAVGGLSSNPSTFLLRFYYDCCTHLAKFC